MIIEYLWSSIFKLVEFSLIWVCFISASASLPAVPTQGTVLVDLTTDDPEYISVDEQVTTYVYCVFPWFIINNWWLTRLSTVLVFQGFFSSYARFNISFLKLNWKSSFQMQSTVREHKDNVGGLFNRYTISKVSWQNKIIQSDFVFQI